MKKSAMARLLLPTLLVLLPLGAHLLALLPAAKASSSATVTCLRGLLELQGGACKGVPLQSGCPAACRDGVQEVQARGGLTQTCLDTLADIFQQGMALLGSAGRQYDAEFYVSS